ncbi:hypothetical protein NL676_002730 [Syzygium grande]|nr:hypothetical protein NL676_002730 [Syzygium grande]
MKWMKRMMVHALQTISRGNPADLDFGSLSTTQGKFQKSPKSEPNFSKFLLVATAPSPPLSRSPSATATSALSLPSLVRCWKSKPRWLGCWEYVFANAGNLEHCAWYLNQTLERVSITRTCNCLYPLLRQRQRNVEFRDSTNEQRQMQRGRDSPKAQSKRL